MSGLSGAAQTLSVAVTGHRDLLPQEIAPLRERVRWFLRQLISDYPQLQLQVLSGMAEGADQLVAEVALELDLPVLAVLPMPLEQYREDFADGGQALEALLVRCELITLPRLPEGSPRDEQYVQLGCFLSNHCQVLLALWDGHDNGMPGGTGSVMAYHLTGLMPGATLEDSTPSLLTHGDNDLAYHIVCGRHRPEGAPEGVLAFGESYWVTGAGGRQSGQHMPFAYHRMLERLAIFARDLKTHAAAIGAGAQSLLQGHKALPSGAALADRLYGQADWLARHYQRQFLRGLWVSHALAVLMGVVFVIYSEFIERWGMALLFMGLFLIGVLFHWLGERREWHRKYLDYRALAEGLRVQVYWNLAGVVEAHSAAFAYDNFLQKQDVDLAWIRHVMRFASLRRDRNQAPDSHWLSWVIDDWIGDQQSGQLGYYQRKATLRARAYRRTQLLGQVALWGGIAMAAVLAVLARQLTELQAIFLLVLMGVLPLLAGVRDAYSHKKADKELIKQYRFMAEVFGNARKLVDDNPDPQLRRRILRALGEAALEEHAEWLLVHRDRPLEHGGI